MSANPKNSYTLVIVGGGSGGISVAARFARYLNIVRKGGTIAVIEPQNVHYYQPLWTLVGAGIKDLPSTARDMSSVMPKGVDWIKDYCTEVDPKNNSIRLAGAAGSIKYEYLIVAAGLNIDWNKIEGLTEALETPGVCSNYSPRTVQKTFSAIENLKNGNAIFTFPNSPVKCPGAPQKIMYLTDAHLRKNGRRSDVTFHYNTALPVIFGVKHYASALMEVCKKRDLNVNTRLNLKRIDPLVKTAYFEQLDHPDKPLAEWKYEMLHVTPPMSAPKFLAPLSSDSANGFVSIDTKTLQHLEFPNVFAIGDCAALPTSKTAAAIASQNYILARNLLQVMQSDGETVKEFPEQYDGYTSCPLVTGNDKCILAEFNYSLEPLETFPLSQAKERTSMYFMKKDVLPFIYWNAMLKGRWRGPKTFRQVAHLGFSN